MRSGIKFAIGWIALAGALAFTIGSITVPTYVTLLKHGERAIATITETDCNNHGQAIYAYSVGSRHFSAKDVMHMFDCKSLHPGDSIPIYYDKINPAISRAIEPRDGLVNDLVPIALACLIFPPLMIAAFLAWYRRNMALQSN